MKKLLCTFYAKGKCDRGPNCGFAHGEDDLGSRRYWAPCQYPNCRNFLMGRPCPKEILHIVRSCCLQQWRERARGKLTRNINSTRSCLGLVTNKCADRGINIRWGGNTSYLQMYHLRL